MRICLTSTTQSYGGGRKWLPVASKSLKSWTNWKVICGMTFASSCGAERKRLKRSNSPCRAWEIPTLFEQAIAEWRRQMGAGGIRRDVLDELESHLRDDVKAQVRSGASGQPALETAVQRLGQARVLKKEFGKGRRNRLGVLFMGVGLVCTVLGGLWYCLALRVAGSGDANIVQRRAGVPTLPTHPAIRG